MQSTTGDAFLSFKVLVFVVFGVGWLIGGINISSRYGRALPTGWHIAYIVVCLLGIGAPIYFGAIWTIGMQP